MTNFLIMWILACRIVTLMYQFKYLRATNIYIPTLCYLGLLTVQSVVPLFLGGYADERCHLMSTSSYRHGSVFLSSYSFRAVYFTLDILEFALPVVADIFMVVSALIFIKSGTIFEPEF
jgi:hypothetical protein